MVFYIVYGLDALLFVIISSDYAKTGNIDYRELCMSILNVVVLNKDEKVKHVFLIYDEDQDGYLQRQELMNVLKATHAVRNDDQVGLHLMRHVFTSFVVAGDMISSVRLVSSLFFCLSSFMFDYYSHLSNQCCTCTHSR